MRRSGRTFPIAALMLAACSAESPAANQAAPEAPQQEAPPVDPDADIWQATLVDTRAGQVCEIKAVDMPPGQSIEFDFYTESDEGLTELYVVGPAIETSSDGSDPVEVKLTFANGTVFKGTGTIQQTSAALQARGAAPLGSSYTGIDGGIAFYKALMESEYLKYSNERGDKFYLDLIGRNDLVQELRDCLGKTEGARRSAH